MSTRITRPIDVIDLFAGCGGFTQGFHEFNPESGTSSPFRTVGAVEKEVAAASTYAANFADEAGGTDHIFVGKIENWDPGTVASGVDVILGGPPCQGFSGLGKEDPTDPRNQLWREYARVVKALHPKIFVIENVDRFMVPPRSPDRVPEFALLEAATDPDGELRDYKLEAKVLNAADYGVPQARKRAIILATHRDLIASHPERLPLQHPAPTHREQKKSKGDEALFTLDVLKDWVPASTVFNETPRQPSTTQLPERRGNPLGVELPGSFRTRELHIGRNPTQLSLDRYAAIPEGGNRHDLRHYPELTTESWLKHRTGSGDVMGRLYSDKPSVTIRTEFYKPEKGRYLHPSENRPITHLEAALLQGFPMDFLWYGSKTQIATQIGNAVPVGLAKAIAQAVYDYLVATGEVR
ncbi:DNA cytosine methyltransferase [Nonomuraea sp. NPDC001684]